MGYFQGFACFQETRFWNKALGYCFKIISYPSELIDELIDNAKNLPLTPDPGWAHWTNTDFRNAG